MKIFIMHLYPSTDWLKTNLSNGQSLCWVLLCIMFGASSVKAQDGFIYTTLPYTFSSISIGGLPNPSCVNNTVAFTTCSWNNAGTPCTGVELQNAVTAFVNATDSTRFLKATAGQSYNVTFGISDNIGWSVNPPQGGVSPVYNTTDGGASFDPNQSWAINTSNNFNDHFYAVTIHFARGSLKGAIVIQV